ncbi:hypothetical protein [Mesorhizobium sp. KR2-14]|uniref:hypothetical protein n=1 Tax=Mesorhizobium sp. KR2-14 TaxID=3156610 RepID=UPI0032B49BFF
MQPAARLAGNHSHGTGVPPPRPRPASDPLAFRDRLAGAEQADGGHALAAQALLACLTLAGVSALLAWADHIFVATPFFPGRLADALVRRPAGDAQFERPFFGRALFLDLR